MNNQKLIDARQLIIDTANNTDNLLLDYKGAKYAAKLYGAKLDFPFIAAVNELGQSIDAEISWHLAERLATGQSNTVIA